MNVINTSYEYRDKCNAFSLQRKKQTLSSLEFLDYIVVIRNTMPHCVRLVGVYVLF